MRRILLINFSQQDLTEIGKLIEAKTFAQLIYQSAENFESLIAIALKAKYDLLLVYGMADYKIGTTEIEMFLKSNPISVILLMDSPTVDQTVDMMNAGVLGVVDWQNMDRAVTLINRHLLTQATLTDDIIYQQIVDCQTELICRYDHDFRLLFVNRAYCEWQGLPADELIGKSFIERIPEIDRKKSIAHVRALSKDNPITMHTHSAVLPDGTVRTIEWTDRAIFDEHGDIQEYQGVGRDVSEREHIEKALRANEDQLQGILNSQTNFVVRTNLEGYYTYLNKKFRDEYGYITKDTNLLGTFSLDSICEYHHERTRHTVEKCIAQPNIVFQVELDKPLEDGSIRTTLWDFVCLLDHNDQPSEIQCVGIDISERKQMESNLRESEEKYRTLIESSDAVIVVVDEVGELYFANEFVAKQMQMDSDAIVGKKLYDLFPPPIVDYQLKLVSKVIRTGQGTVYEARIPIPNEEHWYRASLQPIRNTSGTVDKVLVNATDITLFKNAEAALSQSEEKFRNIYEQSPLAIQLYDNEANLTDVNPRTLELYGLDDKKHLLGYNFWSSPDINEEQQTALRNGQAVIIPSSLDFEIIKKTNLFPTNKSGILYFDIYLIPLVLIGETIGYLTQMVDVTETNRVQSALEVANQQLEQRVLERTKDLEQSKDQIEAIFNHSADSILLLDTELKIQQGNYAFEQMFGVQADIYFNQSLEKLMSDEDKTIIEAQLEDIVEHQETKRFEIQAKHQNGETFDAEISIAPVNRSNTVVENIVCIIRDITARKQAEVQLRYHASLQENVSDAVIATDKHFHIQSWNKAAERIYGWTSEEVIGKSVRDILHTQFPTGVSRNSAKKDLDDADEWRNEVRQQHKNGQWLHISASIANLTDENGNYSGTVAVNHDITSRKQAEVALRESEARYELIVNLSEEAILVTDTEARITYVNPTWVRLTGYSEEETLGQEYFEFLTPENQDSGRKRFQGKKEGKSFRLDTQLVRKDGNTYWVLTSASSVLSPSGEFQGIVLMISDINLRKKTEIALAQSLETEQEMQGYLTALHDISLKLAQTETLDDFYRVIVAEGLSQIGFERIGILLYDESDGSAVGTWGTDANGHVVAEHHLRLQPDSLTGIIQQSLEKSERFVVIENTQLYANLEPIGIGDNAVAALWHDRMLGWLTIDNGVNYQPINQAQLDSLALYALTVGSQLASKQAEIALKASEEKYRIIANNIKDLIIRVDTEFKVSYVSPSSYELLGYQPEEMLEKSGYEFIHPNDLERVKDRVNQTLQSGTTGLRLDERLRHKNSSYLWVEVTAKAIFASATQKPKELILSIRDISERKAAEVEIKAITERLLLATSVGQIGIWYYDDITKQLVWDDQMYAIYGLDASQISPTIENWKTTLHPDDYALAVADLGKSLIQDEVYSGEYRILTPEGEIRHLRIRAMRDLDEKGQHTRTIGVNIDITDLKKAELALRESETRFRKLIDAAPIATVVTDQTGYISLINKQAESLFGYDRSELIGEAVEILIPESVRMQHKQHRSTYMLDPHLREMGANMELYAKRKDNSLFPTEIQLSYVDTPDGLMVMSFVIDITERKRIATELERQRVFLREVIDVSPSMIFVKDIDGQFVFVNPAMADFFDISVENLISKNDYDLDIPEPEIEGFHDTDRRVITQNVTISLEEAITRKSGEVHWLQTTKVPLHSEDGQSIHILGVATDITERKKAEITLQQALAKEQELNKLKSNFISTASHQFRTPLAVILASTETLTTLRNRLDESQIDARLDRIRSQVDRMKGLMDDVLELARMQSNQVRYKPQKNDFDLLCHEIIGDFTYQSQYKDRVVYEGSTSPLMMNLDPQLMHHVVSNLIHNALKYSEDLIYVSLIEREGEIIFTVKDRGIGIPEDDLKNLFIPFNRASNVGAIEGTGLGLSIIKESVEAHSGTIELESTEGIGTTFIVTFPVDSIEEAKDGQNSSD